jgi:type II secretory pathway pseudopilin PulG
MKRRALALVELMTVVAIIGVLVAIVVAVYPCASFASKISVSKSNLRQLHQAAEIYRADWPEEGRLPALPKHDLTAFGVDMRVFYSPCGDPVDGAVEASPLPPPGYQYWYWSRETDYYRKYGNNAMLFIDPFCNEDMTVFENDFATKRGLGVTVGGELIEHLKPGDMVEEAWWTEPVR